MTLALCLAGCQTTPESDSKTGDDPNEEAPAEASPEEPTRRPMDGGKYNRDMHRQTQSDLRRSRAAYDASDVDAAEVFQHMRQNDIRAAFEHLRDQPDFSQVDVVAVPAQE
ncbi:MAG: hypothetical protein AAGF10_05460 [Verrucomicrobiota bacterium]